MSGLRKTVAMRLLVLALLIAIALAAQGVWERRADYPISATEVSAAAIGAVIYTPSSGPIAGAT